MSIFTEIKEHITARQAAEHYGLKVSNKGMACCPFHEDKHPSLKIDTGYYCFGCGAKGSDATGYVAQLFGLSQIDAARKIVADFHLPVDAGYKDAETRKKAQEQYRRQEQERKKSIRDKLKFSKWCSQQIDGLKKAMGTAERVNEKYRAVGRMEEEIPEAVAISESAVSQLDYWLDILCMGTDEEKQELFLYGRKHIADTVKSLEIMLMHDFQTTRLCGRPPKPH